MSQTYTHTHTIKLTAGETLPFPARAQLFLPIKCVSLVDGTLSGFEAAFDDDQSNPYAVGVEVHRGNFFNRITFKNTNAFGISLEFQVSTDDITDRRLIYNPDIPVPILLANGQVAVTALPAVTFDGPQPVTSRQLGMRYSTPNTVSVAASNKASFGYFPGICGYIVQVFSVGKSVIVQIDDAHPIMTIADTDGAIFVPLVGPIDFRNTDLADLTVSITQMIAAQ